MRLRWRNRCVPWLPEAGSVRLRRVPTCPEMQCLLDLRGCGPETTLIWIAAVPAVATQRYPCSRIIALVRLLGADGAPSRWQVKAARPPAAHTLACAQLLAAGISLALPLKSPLLPTLEFDIEL